MVGRLYKIKEIYPASFFCKIFYLIKIKAKPIPYLNVIYQQLLFENGAGAENGWEIV